MRTDERESRENPSDPLCVKSENTEAAGLNILKQVPTDQVAGNHEKYVDTHEPAGEHVRKCMIDENRYDCDRAQPFDVAPELHARELLRQVRSSSIPSDYNRRNVSTNGLTCDIDGVTALSFHQKIV